MFFRCVLLWIDVRCFLTRRFHWGVREEIEEVIISKTNGKWGGWYVDVSCCGNPLFRDIGFPWFSSVPGLPKNSILSPFLGHFGSPKVSKNNVFLSLHSTFPRVPGLIVLSSCVACFVWFCFLFIRFLVFVNWFAYLCSSCLSHWTLPFITRENRGPREARPEDSICFELFVWVSLESFISLCAQLVLARFISVISLSLVVCCVLDSGRIEAAQSAARRF